MFERIRKLFGSSEKEDEGSAASSIGFDSHCKRIKDRDALLKVGVFSSASGDYQMSLPANAFRVLEESNDGDITLVDPSSVEWGGGVFYDRLDIECVSLDVVTSDRELLEDKVKRLSWVGITATRPEMNERAGLHVFISEQGRAMQREPIVRMGFSAVKPWEPGYLLICTARLYNENGHEPTASWSAFMDKVLAGWKSIERCNKKS